MTQNIEEYLSSEALYHGNYDFNCAIYKPVPPIIPMDYSYLVNKPTINGQPIDGELIEILTQIIADIINKRESE